MATDTAVRDALKAQLRAQYNTGAGGSGSWDDAGGVTCISLPSAQILYYKPTADAIVLGPFTYAWENGRGLTGAIHSFCKLFATQFRKRHLISVTVLFDGVFWIGSGTVAGIGLPETLQYQTPTLRNDAETKTVDWTVATTTISGINFVVNGVPVEVSILIKNFEFVPATLGSEAAPLGCDGIKFSYFGRPLPGIGQPVSNVLLNHDGIRLFFKGFCFFNPPACERELPYSWNFDEEGGPDPCYTTFGFSSYSISGSRNQIFTGLDNPLRNSINYELLADINAPTATLSIIVNDENLGYVEIPGPGAGVSSSGTIQLSRTISDCEEIHLSFGGGVFGGNNYLHYVTIS